VGRECVCIHTHTRTHTHSRTHTREFIGTHLSNLYTDMYRSKERACVLLIGTHSRERVLLIGTYSRVRECVLFIGTHSSNLYTAEEDVAEISAEKIRSVIVHELVQQVTKLNSLLSLN
jgi:hypothetical protein